jgi:hypothetical protein
MGKQKIKRNRQIYISQLTRESLEIEYMGLLEISLQKTEIIKNLETQLANKSTRRI